MISPFDHISDAATFSSALKPTTAVDSAALLESEGKDFGFRQELCGIG
jgi:hypothetical protein